MLSRIAQVFSSYGVWPIGPSQESPYSSPEVQVPAQGFAQEAFKLELSRGIGTLTPVEGATKTQNPPYSQATAPPPSPSTYSPPVLALASQAPVQPPKDSAGNNGANPTSANKLPGFAAYAGENSRSSGNSSRLDFYA